MAHAETSSEGLIRVERLQREVVLVEFLIAGIKTSIQIGDFAGFGSSMLILFCGVWVIDKKKVAGLNGRVSPGVCHMYDFPSSKEELEEDGR